MPDTPLLDQVHLPADTRGFDIPQLRQLADELRAETIDAVSVTGGHLGAGLGVVELTVALHHVFETPKDILIWDVGHQCYPHKILTGRRDRIRTLRQPGGLSGFTKRSESEYDPFGAAHASTSISAALGFAAARDQKGEKNRVVAVIGDGSMSAAMPSGTGLDLFGQAFPARTYDVGIAEQHAVTFAAGLAADGMKPVCAIYSTFLQRGYDQVVHDVAIQSLPVRFAMDRAGLVGADGCTHAGSFDIGFMGALPGMVLMAAADEADLAAMIATSLEIDDRPSAFRYPRGDGIGVEIPELAAPLEIGKGRIVREGTTVAILSLGTRLQESLKAAEALAARGVSATVADARFAKPLDADLILRLAREHECLITVEEGAMGGFGAFVLQLLSDKGALDAGLKIRTLCLPDVFQDQDNPAAMYATAGLNAEHIAAAALQALGVEATRAVRA